MRINTGPPVEGDDFFGRKKELKKLADTLSNKNASVFIPGPRRIGKTSLVKEFIRINKEKHQFVFFDLMGRNSIVDFCTDLNKEMASSFPERVQSKTGFRQIWNSISDMIPELKIPTIIEVKTGKLSTPLKELMDKMVTLFEELKDENVIIAFDEFSDFLFKLKNRSNDELTLFLEWLRRIRQQHTVQFIITGSINILSTAEELGLLDLINDMTDLDILPLVDQEIQDLLKVLLADKNVHLTGEAMYFAITILQNGIPFYVQLFADGIDQFSTMKGKEQSI